MAASASGDQQHQSSTRVFKKSCPNTKITAYLGARDFIDTGSAEPVIVDGVALVDEEYVKDRKVYASLLAAFRYGREDLDVLGLAFRKDLVTKSVQVFPPAAGDSRPLTNLQQKLLNKLGSHAYPFTFELPQNSPSSVTLQPAPDDTSKPCGVDYEIKTFVAECENPEKIHRHNTVRLAIRKLTYAPDQNLPQPRAEMAKNKLKFEVSLDKEKYYHGENISVNVMIDNNSTKKIKKVCLNVIQISDIILFSKASHKCVVAEMESEDGMPVLPSQSGFCKVYSLRLCLEGNRLRRGLALDGKIKHEDTNLASSTIIRENANREHLGIVVQYKVKVKLVQEGTLFPSYYDLELPFTLTHRKPSPPPPSRPTSVAGAAPAAAATDSSVDTNLIQLEEGNDAVDDDIIFEDFARLRLQGVEMDPELEGEELDAQPIQNE